MKKTYLGLIAGLVLGLLDGLSAMFIPEAREMLGMIIVSATVKGAITGFLTGMAAGKLAAKSSIILAGLAISLVLSILAAIPSGAYVEILIPGIVIGGICGVVTGKYGR